MDIYTNEKTMCKKKRKKLGAFYTPYAIVDFMLKSVEEILDEKFDIKEGLASNEIKVLDFAAGTGAFICDAVHKAFKHNMCVNDIYNNIQNNFYAFEYDKNTYEILISNLTNIFKEYGFDFDPKNIHNINTLTNEASEIFK